MPVKTPAPVINIEMMLMIAGCKPLTISIGVPSGGIPSEIILVSMQQIKYI